MKLFRWLNALVTRNLRTIEMVGVLMRIFSFSLVSWLGPARVGVISVGNSHAAVAQNVSHCSVSLRYSARR